MTLAVFDDAFLWRALAAGIGVAIVAGPLGSFIVWRRMAYFGDTLAHSALLGVALGFLLGIELQLGIAAVCLTLALLLVALQRQQLIGADTLLGILSHSALSIGLVVIAFLPGLRIDLMGYLFGDILAVGMGDLVWIYVGAAATLGILVLIWRPLLAITVHEELARAEGSPVLAVRLAFMLMMAVTVAVAMKVIGVLLITALLIIPAAAARRFARTPEQMAVLASLLGCIAVTGGLGGSMFLDTPSGPSVVVCAAVLFLFSLLWGARPGASPS